jgi:H+/Na+-translocating ferredoxin:NAD+ oxidoreductase subunit B
MIDLINKIDALLPQTQCGDCGYDGCKPYAEALAHDRATPNLCPPGGVHTLNALGALLNKDVSDYTLELTQNTRAPSLAVIREAECIGCTKCIQACPVDAILGSAKHMHTVISSECTGCQLCVDPCPVDCIDFITLTEPAFDPNQARQRYQARQARLSVKKTQPPQTVIKRDYIAQARARYKQKKGLS